MGELPRLEQGLPITTSRAFPPQARRVEGFPANRVKMFGGVFQDVRTLVIYDISDDRRRGRLREHLREYGLRRIQYSGFMGELNPHDREVLSLEVSRYVEDVGDSIYILPLCSRCLRVCRVISRERISLIEEGEVEMV
jgi:CRISPR-associated protein Cas2